MRKNSWMTHGLGLAMVVAVVLGPLLGLTASVTAAQEISMKRSRGSVMPTENWKRWITPSPEPWRSMEMSSFSS